MSKIVMGANSFTVSGKTHSKESLQIDDYKWQYLYDKAKNGEIKEVKQMLKTYEKQVASKNRQEEYRKKAA